jgi:hypothetical protein
MKMDKRDFHLDVGMTRRLVQRWKSGMTSVAMALFSILIRLRTVVRTNIIVTIVKTMIVLPCFVVSSACIRV